MRRWLILAALLLVPVAGQAQTIEYYGLDAIGSVRVVFDANGNVLSRADYAPFGEPLFPATGKQQQVYGGLFAEGEAGFDYAEARMYQPRTGRFNTVDPVYAGLFQPQAWNRYAYALNAPLLYADPTGLMASSGNTVCETVEGRFTCRTGIQAVDTSLWWSLFVWDLGGGWAHSGGGGWSDVDFGGGGSLPPTQTPNTDSPTAPPTPPNPPPPGPPENPEQPTTPLRAFIKGCGEGAAIVADSAIPFVDPFEAAGLYSDETPGADISRVLADISMGLLSVAGSIRGLADLTYRAPRGSLLYRINNNQYARIGYSMWPRTQGRVPRISIPTFKFRQWEFEGRHWDLRVCGR